MKCLIGSICFLSLAGLAQGDEFSLNLSSDIVDSAQPIGNELDALPLTNPDRQGKGVLPVLPELKVENEALKQDGIKKPDEAESRSKTHFSISKPTNGNVKPSKANQFGPIQTVPADSFFAQYQREWAPKTAFYSDNPSQSDAAVDTDALEQTYEELRTLVGEDMYFRMVWAYRDVKELDDWIYASIERSGLFSQGSFLMNLNDQLFAGLTTFTGSGSVGEHGNAFNDWQNGLQTQQALGVKSEIDKEALRVSMESQSVFYEYLKYLTPLNIIYFVLIGMVLYYCGRFFRFLIRQQ